MFKTENVFSTLVKVVLPRKSGEEKGIYLRFLVRARNYDYVRLPDGKIVFREEAEATFSGKDEEYPENATKSGFIHFLIRARELLALALKTFVAVLRTGRRGSKKG